MKEKRTEKPGVMIYGDLHSTIARLDDAQAGQLFRAIMDYGLEGTMPQLPSPLDLLWPMIQLRLDADDDRYYDVINKRSYAAYVRWAKEKNQTPLSYESWLEKDAHQKTPEEAPTAQSPSHREPMSQSPSGIGNKGQIPSGLDPFYRDLVTPDTPAASFPF